MNGSPEEPGRQDMFLIPLESARARLQSVIANFKHGGVLAPVTVICPTNYAGLDLRHHLGESGFANVRFMTMPRLAELLGGASLAAKGKLPLTRSVEIAAVRAVAAGARHPLFAWARNASFHSSLRATFRDLRHAAPDSLQRLAGFSAALYEVVRLYRAFVDLTLTYYDPEDLAHSAAEAVEAGRAPALGDIGAVVFYLPGDLTPAAQALILSLSRATGSAVILGLTGDEKADAPVRAMESRLARALGACLQDGPQPPARGEHLLIAPDAHEEVRWIVRRVLSRKEQGVPFHRIAVLYRQPEPYSLLVREQLKFAGIPAAGPSGATLAMTATGKLLSGLIALADGDFRRERLIDWLTSCPVYPGGPRTAGFHPSQWDVISRAAGIVKGREQWSERLEAFAQQQEMHARDPEEAWREEAGLGRLRQEAVHARSLSAFVSELAGRLEKRPPDGSRWSEFAGWLLGLLDRYLDQAAMPPGTESEARVEVFDGLRQLSGLEAIQPGATFEGVKQAAGEMLAVSTGHLGNVGEGVFVAPLSAAAGMRFDSVYVVGMVEGLFPPASPGDPLVPDSVRHQHGAQLPLRSDRLQVERRLFLSALAAGERRVLSFPLGSPGAARRQAPSRWFLEAASQLGGETVYATSIQGLNGDWLTVLPSRNAGLERVPVMAAADLHDRDVHALWRWRESGRGVTGHHLARSDALLGRAIRMELDRITPSLSRWDGDVSSLGGRALALRSLAGRVLAPTSLERWAACPFQYLLSNVFGIAALKTPEDVENISALNRGLLVHEVLREFMQEVIAGGPPGPGEPWSGSHRSRLLEIAVQKFSDAELRGVTGRQFLWEMTKEQVLDDLDEFLRHDTELRAHFRSVPHAPEVLFGKTGSVVPVADCDVPGVGTVRFRGAIDRVDLADGGKTALVIDYKTGRRSYYEALDDDPVDGGRRLQLQAYGLAAKRLLPETEHVISIYWFVSAKGGFRWKPDSPSDLSAQMLPFENALSVIARGIQSGYFPANPGDRSSSCKHCDFDSLCAARRDLHWERKQRDPRLHDYVRMALGAQS